MKILIVDQTTEGQSLLASKVQSLDPGEIESLNISLQLCGPQQCLQRLDDIDILFLGPNLGEKAHALARSAKSRYSNINVLLFVTDHAYRAGAYRFARIARVRKVFPESCEQLDLLQELVGIFGDLADGGRVKSGKVIAVTHAKGGVGATTFCAAMAEICNRRRRPTLLWDCDIESRDLTRAMMSDGENAMVVTDWVTGKRHISRNNFNDGLTLVGEHVSLLPPPESTAAALDMVGHVDCIEIVQRLIDLARLNFENIIVDLAGRLGPTSGSVLRSADAVVIVVDDSILGMMAVDAFLDSLLPILQHRDSVYLIGSGTRLNRIELKENVDEQERLNSSAWELPAVPFDGGAARWPGSGKTLYGHAASETKEVLDAIALKLGLVEESKEAGSPRMSKIFGGMRTGGSQDQESGSLHNIMHRVMSFTLHE